MPIVIFLLGIAVLLLLIMRFRVNAFLALLLVSTGIGLGMGAAPASVLKSVQNGIGGTLGYLAPLLGLGAMLGALIADSGAAEVITHRLIRFFGQKRLHWALMLTGFIVGIPMFYNVAFLMLIPLVFAIARSAKLPLVYVGIPAIASLSVTHGFLPPHPAPSAIAVEYGADLSLVMIYGLILAVPTVILAGAVFGSTLRNFSTPIPAGIFPEGVGKTPRAPAFGLALFVALVPVLLMGASAGAELSDLPEESAAYVFLRFVGDPMVALLLSVLLAVWLLGINLGKPLKDIMFDLTTSVKAIAMIMLIIAGGGALKQVLIDSGISEYVVDLLRGANIPPLVLAWLVAACLRVAIGSATVSALTAAGIVVPMLGEVDVSPELLVLATGAGSLTLSQVNDTGFWMFKEYFGLTIPQTLKTWTVMETIVSVVGLLGCLVLEQFI